MPLRSGCPSVIPAIPRKSRERRSAGQTHYNSMVNSTFRFPFMVRQQKNARSVILNVVHSNVRIYIIYDYFLSYHLGIELLLRKREILSAPADFRYNAAQAPLHWQVLSRDRVLSL